MSELQTNANVTDAALASIITRSAGNLKSAAIQNVAAILNYGLQRAFTKKNKDVHKRNAQDRLLDAGLSMKTVYRQVGAAFKALALIEKAHRDHVVIKSALDAEDAEASFVDTCLFLSSMGCQTVEDVDLWCKGEGAPLTADQKHATRQGEREAKSARALEAAARNLEAKQAAALADANDAPTQGDLPPMPEAPPADAAAGMERDIALILSDVVPYTTMEQAERLMRALNAHMKALADATVEGVAA